MVSIRIKIYDLMVNRLPGISHRYHKVHDGSAGMKKLLSWAYLLWLNFAYYFLFMHFLGKKRDVAFYEERTLPMDSSESAAHVKSEKLSACNFVEELSSYDIISFDVFDTLIFRPFSEPADLFHLIGKELGIMDFVNIRTQNEYKARLRSKERFGHMEVDLKAIWEIISEDAGFDPEKGMKVETELEETFCFANPFMKKVYSELISRDKYVIITTDMYLPADVIEHILTKNGFSGYGKLYLSNEYGCSKADGKLYGELIKDHPGKRIIHVGDNRHSDVDMALKAGLSVKRYPNVNKNMLLYRPYDMSAMVGSAYRAIVNTYLYNGLNMYSQEYEYGFIYGGLFVMGYCSFIHEYVKNNGIDKVLFLSRDGDTLKKAYDLLYPGENTSYVYWSRKAATKLEAFFDKHDYFRRFISHKVNQGYTVREILSSMELEGLSGEKYKWFDAELTDKNETHLRRFIESKWDSVLEHYKDELDAAGTYYRNELKDVKKAIAVDIGWAGSGALCLRYLIENIWMIDCDLRGMLAGTNTIYNAEPDTSEAFLQSGILTAYLYSQSHNRDLLKKHDPNKDYNVFWELLLSSPTRKFCGFHKGDRSKDAVYRDGTGAASYDEKLDITLVFGDPDSNTESICEIQKGIIDFVKEYRSHFAEYPYMERISGRDAYAPMLAAAGKKERYLKNIEEKFCFEKNVI